MMQLIRFVAVACMVAVSVASLGCGESAKAPEKKMDKDPPAETGSVESSSGTKVADATGPATTGMTKVSLAISGMH